MEGHYLNKNLFCNGFTGIFHVLPRIVPAIFKPTNPNRRNGHPALFTQFTKKYPFTISDKTWFVNIMGKSLEGTPVKLNDDGVYDLIFQNEFILRYGIPKSTAKGWKAASARRNMLDF